MPEKNTFNTMSRSSLSREVSSCDVAMFILGVQYILNQVQVGGVCRGEVDFWW